MSKLDALFDAYRDKEDSEDVIGPEGACLQPGGMGAGRLHRMLPDKAPAVISIYFWRFVAQSSMNGAGGRPCASAMLTCRQAPAVAFAASTLCVASLHREPFPA